MDVDTPGQQQGAALAELDRWVAAGLVTPEQAKAIAAFEAASPNDQSATTATTRAGGADVSHAAARQRLVIEALTYVGSAVIIAALTVVTVGYWESLGRAWQITIPAFATGGLLVAGAVIPAGLGAVGVRSRGALWMVSTATFTGLAAVVADALGWVGPSVPRAVSILAFLYALPLWLRHRFVTQQAASFAATLFVAVAMFRTLTHGVAAAGIAISIVGIAWGIAARQGWLPGQGRLLPPAAVSADSGPAAAAERKWGTGIAAGGAAIGAIMLANSEATAWSGVLPVVVILAAGIAWGSIAVIVIGALASLVAFPAIAEHYLHSTVAVAVVLLATGAVMVAIAVTMVRRRQSDRGRGYSR